MMSSAPSGPARAVHPASHDRTRVRFFPLDGAALWFQPATGLHVRAQLPRFAGLRRLAPRVVMFGITNACNLRCSFCSRDQTRGSDWTVSSAARILRDLAQAGTQEVAFGGGEPFLFPGFAELIEELHATTPLALHATSNGTQLARALPRLHGKLSEVRLSLYDEPRWQAAATALDEHAQRWGANLLIDRARLPHLPALLAELAARGCRDVALLPYLGEPDRALDDGALATLAALVREAPLPCRISVCFGERLAVPHLPYQLDAAGTPDGPARRGGDCGAGLDFVTLTSDRRVQSCSFQDESLPRRPAPPVVSGADVLQVWRRERAELARAAARSGCARQLAEARPGSSSAAAAAAPWPALALWHAFSGNNSGECVLVGKLETGEAARRYVEELTAGLAADEPYSQAWRELFAREGVSHAEDLGAAPEFEFRTSPRMLLAIGRSVVATSYEADDPFPELRALTWKRGGYVVAGGIHLHHDPDLLAVIRARDARDAEAVAAQLLASAAEAASAPQPPQQPPQQAPRVERHGELVIARLPLGGGRGSFDSELTGWAARLVQLAQGRPLAAEPLLTATTDQELTAALQRLGAELSVTPRLWISFWGQHADSAAERLARSLADPAVRAYGANLLVEGVQRRKRLAVLALRHGGHVRALEETSVEVTATWWHLPVTGKGRKPQQPRVEHAAIESALRAALSAGVQVNQATTSRGQVRASLVTADPTRALTAMFAAAQAQGCRVNLHVRDLDPLAHCLRRLIAEVRS